MVLVIVSGHSPILVHVWVVWMVGRGYRMKKIRGRIFRGGRDFCRGCGSAVGGSQSHLVEATEHVRLHLE